MSYSHTVIQLKRPLTETVSLFADRPMQKNSGNSFAGPKYWNFSWIAEDELSFPEDPVSTPGKSPAISIIKLFKLNGQRKRRCLTEYGKFRQNVVSVDKRPRLVLLTFS